MRKGSSVIVSAVLGVAILLAIMGIVAFGVTSYQSRVSVSAAQTEAEALSSSIASQIVSLYTANQDSDTSPLSSQNVTIAETLLNVPAKVAGQDYTIELIPRGEYWASVEIESFGDEVEEVSTTREYSSVKVTTTGDNSITVTTQMNNLPLKAEGSVSGKTTVRISFVKTHDGSEITSKMVLS